MDMEWRGRSTIALATCMVLLRPIGVNAGPGPGTPAQVRLTSFPVSIPADGVSTLRVDAEVADPGGGRVADGTTVTFSVTDGTITPEVTTKNGRATAVLRSTASPGIVKVTATCAGGRGLHTVYFGERPFGVMTERTAQFVLADGVSTSAIIAKAGGMKSYAPDGTVVRFSTDLGEIVSQSTTIGGHAIVLVSSREPGTAHITAECAPGTGKDVAEVQFVPAEYRLSLGANAWHFPAANGNQITLVARLRDADDTPLYVNRVPVEFHTTRGRLSARRVLTRSGQAVVALMTEPGDPGEATVIARTAKAEAALKIHFTGPPARLRVSRNLPDRAAPDGSLHSKITVTVQDSEGRPVYGAEVRFLADRGDIVRSASTGWNGKAIAELHFPARVGEVLVTAQCGDLEEVSKSIRFTGEEGTVTDLEPPDRPAKIRLGAARQYLSEGRIIHGLEAVVEDSKGRRLVGEKVRFAATAGDITDQSETDRLGVARAVLAGPDGGTETLVTATVGDIRTSKTIPLPVLSDVRSIDIKPLPRVIKADGTSEALLRIYLRNESKEWVRIPGNAEPQVEVPSGVELWAWSATGPWASYFVRSTATPGPIIVRASWRDLASATKLVFADAPASLSLECHPPVPSPSQTIYIRATVRDKNGNPVADGTPVTFSLRAGDESVGSTTQEGFAVVRIDSVRDLAEVSATCGTLKSRLALTGGP